MRSSKTATSRRKFTSPANQTRLAIRAPHRQFDLKKPPVAITPYIDASTTHQQNYVSYFCKNKATVKTLKLQVQIPLTNMLQALMANLLDRKPAWQKNNRGFCSHFEAFRSGNAKSTFARKW